MRKVTTLWIAAALMAISFGVGCKSEKPPASSEVQTTNVPAAPKYVHEPFRSHLPKGFQFAGADEETVRTLLFWYGAVLVARGDSTPPPVLVFSNEEAVQHYQVGVKIQGARINGIRIELQTPAMEALQAARREAQMAHADITPRGTDSSRRSYADTVRLWDSRVKPGLAHWVAAHRLKAKEAKRITALDPMTQTREILHLEEDGLYFNLKFDGSILSSVAPPGASQHLSMLALDINEYEIPKVREILARHGWFQTALDDLPHFTYMGVTEADLPGLGLRKERMREMLGEHVFWLPDLEGRIGM
jgi:hypothetical protein